jgi:hypothetical protein
MDRGREIVEDCIITHSPNCPTYFDNYLHEGELKLRSEAQEDGLHFCGVRYHQVHRVPATDSKRAMKEIFLQAQIGPDLLYSYLLL